MLPSPPNQEFSRPQNIVTCQLTADNNPLRAGSRQKGATFYPLLSTHSTLNAKHYSQKNIHYPLPTTHHPLLILLSLLLSLPLSAQEARYDYDDQCGCDIFYVDGIETTRDGDRYGFRRDDGTVIAPNIYLYVGQFLNGYCKVYLEENRCGIIDRDGHQIVPCLYEAVELPSEDRVLVYRDGLFGFCDLFGDLVIPLQYLQAGSFSEGLAPVLLPVDSNRSACTFIDKKGKQLFPPRYENLQPFSCGHALVCKDSLWGLIDRRGRIVLPTLYPKMTTLFADTLFFAGSDEGMALFNASMHPLTPPVYIWNSGLSDRRIAVRRNGKYGFIDSRGREIIPCIYDEVSPFFDARAKVRIGDSYGIIDTTGRIVLPLEYEDTSPKSTKYILCDGLALIEKNGHFGFVDREGRVVIPICFQDAYQFSEGLAPVQYNGRWGYLDTRGNAQIPFVFDLASPFEWGRAEVYYQGTPHKIDLSGRCVKNCKGIKLWKTNE